MKTSQFDYHLPENLIAQSPSEKREQSRLMIINRENQSITHHKFYEIIDYLNEDDLLIMNNTRVIPARLIGRKEDGSSIIEILLIKEIDHLSNRWIVMMKPAKRLKIGQKISFGDGKLHAELIEILESGERIVEFKTDGNFKEVLDEIGLAPLPPYIIKARDKNKTEHFDNKEDKRRYQTIFAQTEGSVAAPTAGFHFSEELLKQIIAKGIKTQYITLHIGPGTFLPVKSDNVEDHVMHFEDYEITADVCNAINEAKQNGKRIVAVGTTVVRTLESACDEQGILTPKRASTDLLIVPGYKFKMIDAMITNFHLPCSTLLMLVSGFAGTELIKKSYETAVENQYRFYSFGDAMFIE